ncbi:MAG: DNA polymerase III subunit gamma/tau [Tannerella sp.]|jgi:DNA polymerase-3 subunit gamma/tau|nr:DNA polymerase III subunit gamma/tau [Tannerella sp.]
MEDYIVSARKYRPSTFKSVVGQKSLVTTLKNSILGNKLAHAYLFCGPRGVGKTSCARIFAKTINCQHLTVDGEACNECESCRSINEQRSLNLHELDAASNNSVDDIRSLTDQVRFPPQIGKYKVYIIDEVHMLSSAAFNAFLKTLEEPPHHAIFILATTEKQKVIPTILSRCQIYDFSRITIEDIVEHLQYVATQEHIQAEAEALNVIAQKADGGMRDALSIFDQIVSFTGGNITYKSVIDNLNVLDYEYYFRFTEEILKGNVKDCLLILNEILEKGFDGQNIISGLATHFRNLLVCRDEQTIVLFEVGASIRERYRDIAKKCSEKLLYKAIELANRCDYEYRNSQNKRLLLELTLIQICQLSDPASSEDEKKKPLIKPLTEQKTPPNQTPTSVSTVQQPAQVSQNKPVANTPEKSYSRSTSLKGLLKSDEEKKEFSAVQTHDLDSEFSQEDLQKYWIEYANTLGISKIHFKNTLLNCKPQLKKDAVFEVGVHNPTQQEEISENTSVIISYLISKLNNSHLKMTIRILEKDEKEMIYTSTEKFNYLINKNPSLEKLIETFNLTME